MKKLLRIYFAAKAMNQVFPDPKRMNDGMTEEQIKSLHEACARIAINRADSMIKELFQK